MPFYPSPGQPWLLSGATYRVAEHPAAPGMPYGQEGRAATVYKLLADGGGEWALKVFKPRFRVPGLVSQAERLAAYARLDGLAVCQRSVLTPQRDDQLLRAQPELLYAVFMPWVQGPTWMQVLLEQRALPPQASLALARTFAGLLAELEQNELAHCDLSGPNVLLPMLDSGHGIELVDVEQLYAPDLRQPSALPAGSPGYAHRLAKEGVWSADADRFGGALLLAEMLGWCEQGVRRAAWGESYFEPAETDHDNARYQTLKRALVERWGANVAELFEAAWRSDVLAACPTFGEWLLTLPLTVPDKIARVLEPSAPQEPPTISAPQIAEDETDVLPGGSETECPPEEMDSPEAVSDTNRDVAVEDPEASISQEMAPVIVNVEQQIEDQAEQGPDDAAEAKPTSNEIDQLFVQGIRAYDAARWAEAVELMGEVVHRQPDYTRDGWSAVDLVAAAVDLVAAAEQQIRAKGRRRVRKQVAIALALCVFGVVVFFVAGFALGGLGGASEPTPTARGFVQAPTDASSSKGLVSDPTTTPNYAPVYEAVYVADVTIPDGTSVNSGQAFDKTWRIRNSGSITWPDGTRLVFTYGQRMGPHYAGIPVPSVEAGSETTVTVPLVAPDQAGNYMASWRLQSPQGKWFGPILSVNIEVWKAEDAAAKPSLPAQPAQTARPTSKPAPTSVPLVASVLQQYCKQSGWIDCPSPYSSASLPASGSDVIYAFGAFLGGSVEVDWAPAKSIEETGLFVGDTKLNWVWQKVMPSRTVAGSQANNLSVTIPLDPSKQCRIWIRFTTSTWYTNILAREYRLYDVSQLGVSCTR